MSLHIDFQSRLAAFLSVGLITAPTPFVPLRRLSAYLGGSNIWIKRDDVVHPAAFAYSDVIISALKG